MLKPIIIALMIFGFSPAQAANEKCEYKAKYTTYTADGVVIPNLSYSTDVVREKTGPGTFHFTNSPADKKKTIDFSLSWGAAPFKVEIDKVLVEGVCPSLGFCVGKTIGKSNKNSNSSFFAQFDDKTVRATSVLESNIVIQDLQPTSGTCEFRF